MAGEINYGLLNPNTAALAAGSVLAGQQAAEERQANKLRQQMQMQQFGQEQQMNALKMQQAQQEMADQNALRDIYRTSGGDVNKLYEGAMGAGLGKQAMEFQKMQREQQAEKVKQAGEHLKLMKGLATNVMANPTFETAAASLQQFSAITGQDMSQELSRLQAIGSNPDAIRQWAAGHALEADKLLPKFQNISAGGYEQLGTIDYTGKFTPTQRIEKTLTPGEIQSNINAELSRKQEERHFKLGQKEKDTSTFNAELGGFITKPSKEYPQGKFTPLEGGAAKPAKVTEGERKSATLLKRMEGSLSQLNSALEQDPKAQKPQLLSSGLRTIGLEALGNVATSGKRQQVEAAQLDILDAALTLGTGAAYTREQLEGYRKSYFPQIGDNPATVADKNDRLNNVIEAAKIAAGPLGEKSKIMPKGEKMPKKSLPTGWSVEEH